MFEKFHFTQNQVERHYRSGLKDFNIASKSEIAEVSFRFCYDAIIKLAITICAHDGLRVKARTGHHIELIQKLADYLGEKEIILIVNDMRTKRNRDLYGDGFPISEREIEDYIKWTRKIFDLAEPYLKRNKRLKL